MKMSGQGNDRSYGRPPHMNKNFPPPPGTHPLSYPPNLHNSLAWQNAQPHTHLFHPHSTLAQFPIPHNLPLYPTSNVPILKNSYYPQNPGYSYGTSESVLYPPYPPHNPLFHALSHFHPGAPQDVHLGLYPQHQVHSQPMPPGQYNHYQHQFAQLNQGYPPNQPWPTSSGHTSFLSHSLSNFQPGFHHKQGQPHPFPPPPPFSLPQYTGSLPQHSNVNLSHNTSHHPSQTSNSLLPAVSLQTNKSQLEVSDSLLKDLPFSPQSHVFPIEPTPKELDSCPPSPEKPTLLYKLLSQIGEGAYGKVYKALNLKTQTFVALKCLILEQEQEGLPYTALREIKLLQNLKSQFVVQLSEVLTVEKSIYMVFEYMDYDLEGFLAHPESNITPNNIRFLMRQVLSGLTFLHDRGVVHRDLKGSNILLNKKGALKIADFGLARIFDQKRNQDYTNRVITLWYRPPELLLGSTNYFTEVDIWGAGCIMAEMFLRRTLFPGKDEIDQLDSIYKLMGTPDKDSWPGIVDLPWYQLLLPKSKYQSQFKDVLSKSIPSSALSLIEKMLTMNPKSRISASEALSSDYFKHTTTDDFQSFPKIEGDWHEFEVKHKKRKELSALRKARPVTPVSKGSVSPSRKLSSELDKLHSKDKIDSAHSAKTNLSKHAKDNKLEPPDIKENSPLIKKAPPDDSSRLKRNQQPVSVATCNDIKKSYPGSVAEPRSSKVTVSRYENISSEQARSSAVYHQSSRDRRGSISPRKRGRSPSPEYPVSRNSYLDLRFQPRSSRHSQMSRHETHSSSQLRSYASDRHNDSRASDRTKFDSALGSSRASYDPNSYLERSSRLHSPSQRHSSRNTNGSYRSGSYSANNDSEIKSQGYNSRNQNVRLNSSHYSSRDRAPVNSSNVARDSTSISYRDRSRSRGHTSRRY